MSTPDWKQLSKVTLKECCEFCSEKYTAYIRNMYRDIIMNKDRDNEEIKAVWLRLCSHNHYMKTNFLAFILETRGEQEYRPIDHKDILRYFTKMSISNEQEAFDLKCRDYKYD